MIKYEKQYVNLINGERIAYIEKGKSKEKILLLHGNMASSVHMVTLIDKLKDRYHVIAPDLRGFGDSSFNNSFMSLKELAFDLILFCQKLEIANAHVIGWSTGFGVAMELAIIQPSLVKSLFSLEGMSVKGYYSLRNDKDGNEIANKVFNSYLEMKQDKSMQFICDALATGDYDLIRNIWNNTLLVVKKVNDYLLDLYVKETLKQRCQMNINWCWVNFNISDEPNLYAKGTGEMHGIKCPIYLTLGLKDNIVTEKMIMENAKLLNNPKLFIFENAGHCLHYDELDKLVAIIKNHLS
ncbi:MAG: alpha/beta hydrolase [Acholeplasmataceae bacterium]